MLAKNLSLGAALYKIPFRICLDAVSAWQNLLRGDAGYFKAIFKAHIHFFKWMLFEKKQSVFPQKTDGKVKGCYRGSVVWQYFIQKKKTFSEIVDNK